MFSKNDEGGLFPLKYLGLWPLWRHLGGAFFYHTGFTADDLRRTTSACFRLGYFYVLVDRVY